MNADIISMTGNRNNNQDSLLACGQLYTGEEFLFRSVRTNEERPALFAVADGMGGEQYGEIASETVLLVLNEAFEQSLEDSGETEDWVNALLNAVQEAQRIVENAMNERNTVGGTTVSALLLYKGRFVALNIGDSPIYLIRKRDCVELSKEHTLARMKIDDGVPEKRISESDRHCLVQCIGSGGYSEVNVCEGEYLSGDIFAVMSDGMVIYGDKKAQNFLRGKDIWKHIEDFKKAEDNVSAVIIRI
ncbi:MAG: serine/threonine-protein phosphatase [Clostridia bacterium]|nr:serine/threonine-protein phosphatase [Clostridia bacterium]MBR3819184.1 serine/threonine-protein phosphatase [Clostridia bacterium]